MDNTVLVVDLKGGFPAVVFDLKGITPSGYFAHKGYRRPGIWPEWDSPVLVFDLKV